jgi:hypothetical protein
MAIIGTQLLSSDSDPRKHYMVYTALPQQLLFLVIDTCKGYVPCRAANEVDTTCYLAHHVHRRSRRARNGSYQSTPPGKRATSGLHP